MGDFERRAAEIPVDHPAVVSKELRKAVVHYRALFDDLLEVREVERGDLAAGARPCPSP